MSFPKLRVAILIISTTAANDPSTDASEAILKHVLEQEGGGKWEVVDTRIVPDVVVQIQRQIMLWADVHAQEVNLILTTGGTGFAVSDHTPEVANSLGPVSSVVGNLALIPLIGSLCSAAQASARARAWYASNVTKRDAV